MTDEIDTSAWPDTDDIRGWVEWRTRNLRSGNPGWEPIAAQLRAHGLDPQTLILADLWPDDPAEETAVVVTPIGQVFEFEYRWSGESRSDGTFTLRKDLTDSWRIDVYPKAAVAVALELVREQSQRPLQADRRTNAHRLRADVAHHTQQMRSVNTHWKPLANALIGRGIDLTTAAFGMMYSEREHRALSYIVTGDGRIIQYDFQVRFSGDGTTVGEFTDWEDVTACPTLDPHEQDLIRAALEVAKAG